MACLVPADQHPLLATGVDDTSFYPAFLAHITTKFRGIRAGTFAPDRWERELYDAVMAYTVGEMPYEVLNAAFAAFSSDGWDAAAAAGLDASTGAILAAEHVLVTWLFPLEKPSKGTRRKAYKGTKKEQVEMAAAAVAFVETNSVDFMGAEMAAALPEAEARRQQEEEENDDDDEDDADEVAGESGPAPVSFENLPFR